MKFRTEKHAREVPHTLHGRTHMVRESVEVPVPPADWDLIALRAAVTLVLALTAVAVAWSTWSIGDLLGGGFGYAAAVLFDLAWVVCLLLEWLGRYDPAKRRYPAVMGWVLLAATMAAIAWHGLLLDNIALAVVGAAVSLVAKILWLGVLRHIHRELSPVDQQWVKAETSAANASQALATIIRQTTRAKRRAEADLWHAQHGGASQVRAIAAPHHAAPRITAAPQPQPQPQPEAHQPQPQQDDAPRAEAPQGDAPHQEAPQEEAPQPQAQAQHDAPGGDVERQDAPQPETPRPTPVPPSVADPVDVNWSNLTKARAVALMDRQHPGESAPQIARRLAAHGITISDAYVRTVRSRTSGPYL